MCGGKERNMSLIIIFNHVGGLYSSPTVLIAECVEVLQGRVNRDSS